MFFLQKLQLFAEFCCQAKEKEGLGIASRCVKSTLKSLDLFVKLLSFVKIKVISCIVRVVVRSQIPTTLKTLETSNHASTPTPYKHKENMEKVIILFIRCWLHVISTMSPDGSTMDLDRLKNFHIQPQTSRGS